MRVLLWCLGGVLAGAAFAFAVGLLLLTFGGVSQAEGAAAMGVMFFYTPVGAILGAVVGLVLGLNRRGR